MYHCILDTDIGSDCDDAGAMGILHQLAWRGECHILAVTHCLSRQSGPACIDAINRYYGRGDIPIGTLKLEGYYPREITDPYTDHIQREFLSAYPPGAPCPDATGLLRHTLAQQSEKIDLCFIGPLTNLYLLLRSEADEYCTLNGLDLVEHKVNAVYIMGCNFDEREDKRSAEFNIKSDIEAAQYVMRHCPVEIDILPYEVGCQVHVGSALLREGAEDNPVRRCYELYCNKDRETWDLLTVLLMVRPQADYWEWSERGRVSIDAMGNSLLIPDTAGNCRVVLRVKQEKTVARLLDELLTAQPGAQRSAVNF